MKKETLDAHMTLTVTPTLRTYIVHAAYQTYESVSNLVRRGLIRELARAIDFYDDLDAPTNLGQTMPELEAPELPGYDDSERKTASVCIAMTVTMKDRVRRAAWLNQESVSAFVRRAAITELVAMNDRATPRISR